jgi:hypothetical protein
MFPFLDKKSTPKKTTPTKKEEASGGKKSPKSAGKKVDGAAVRTPQQPRKGNKALDSSVLNDSQAEIPGTPQVKNNLKRNINLYIKI